MKILESSIFEDVSWLLGAEVENSSIFVLGLKVNSSIVELGDAVELKSSAVRDTSFSILDSIVTFKEEEDSILVICSVVYVTLETSVVLFCSVDEDLVSELSLVKEDSMSHC